MCALMPWFADKAFDVNGIQGVGQSAGAGGDLTDAPQESATGD